MNGFLAFEVFIGVLSALCVFGTLVLMGALACDAKNDIIMNSWGYVVLGLMAIGIELLVAVGLHQAGIHLFFSHLGLV